MSFFNDVIKQPKSQPRAKWPPVVNCIDVFGELREEDTFRYSRGIGCSSTLHGIPLFLFGDTYEQQANSEFLGIASSTVSLGSHANPTFTRYPSYSPPSGADGESYAIQFIPFTQEENEFNLSAKRDPKNSSDRYYLWTFNAVIEIPGNPGYGVIWFMKGKTSEARENNKYYGLGVAEVKMEQVAVVGAEFAEEMPVVNRRGDVIFDASSPQWGNVATLLDGDFIYLYGTHHQQDRRRRNAGTSFIGFAENPVFVCRVPHADKSYLFPDRYTYWDGETFSAAPPRGESKTSRPHLEPVFFNIQTGTVFHTTLFSSTKEGLFAMMGCDKSGDGKVRFKIAENPWGPWRGEGWLLDIATEDRGYKGAKSCIYVHLWASDLERGELMLSWSEPWPGGVEMIKIGFELVGCGSEEELEKNVDDDADSMFSDVEERLIHSTGRQPSREGQNTGYDYVRLSTEEEERDTARRRALAKLIGDVENEDFQGYLDEHGIRHNPFDSGCDIRPSSLRRWGQNLFGGTITDTLLQQHVSGDELAGLEDPPREPSGSETEYECEGAPRNEEIQSARKGMRRLTDLSQETWYARQYGNATKSGGTWFNSEWHDDSEGSRTVSLDDTESYYDSESSRATNPDDVESYYDSKGGRAAIPDDVKSFYESKGGRATISDVEMCFRATRANSEHSSLNPLNMRLENPAEDVSQENRKEKGKRADTEYGDEELIPSTITERRRRLKWGTGVKADVSSASERSTRPQPVNCSCRPMVAQLNPASRIPKGPQQQTPQQEDQQGPSHWQTGNRSVGPSVTGVDGKIEMKVSAQRGGDGYAGGGYVTELHEIHSQLLGRSAESPGETQYGTKGQKGQSIESQQPEPKRSGRWLKAVKKGMQKLMHKNHKKQVSEKEDKFDNGLCRGLKKKFSEMKFPSVGKSHGKGHVKPRRSEVDLGEYVREKNEETLRRFAEAQFGAGN